MRRIRTARKRCEDLTDEELDRRSRSTCYAYFRLCRAALRHLKPGAAIIATSSETGFLGSTELPDYSATKGAINAFTKRSRRTCSIEASA